VKSGLYISEGTIEKECKVQKIKLCVVI